jgi:hypothetical protein
VSKQLKGLVPVENQINLNIFKKRQPEYALDCLNIVVFLLCDYIWKLDGYTSLEIRRKIKKLILLYKIVSSIAPDYLIDLLPQTVGLQHYQLRSNLKILKSTGIELPFSQTPFSHPLFACGTTWNTWNMK